MKATFFVTGANGFIGNAVVSYLAKRGHEVYALLRVGSLPSFALHDNIHIRYGDLQDTASLLKAMPTRAYVVNLAANPYHRTLSYDVNVVGTQNLLDVATKQCALKFIQISSQATKIKHKGVYANTKLAADRIVEQATIPYVILKPSLVYGEGEKGLFAKVALLASKLPCIPVFGDGKVHIFPIHADDLSALIEKVAVDTKARTMTFDAGGTSAITYKQLYTQISNHSPNHPFLLHIPKTLGLLLTAGLSVLPNPPIVADNVLGSTQDTHCDPKPLLKRYSYKPITFAEGFSRVFAPKSIRVAIIGLGKMGMLHATILNTFSNVQIVALIDTNPKLVGTFKSMGIAGQFFLSFAEAIQQVKIDAVYITTPTFAHHDLLITMMKKGIHTFIEKPVTLNQSEVAALQKIKSTAVVRAGYTMLYHRPFQELHRIISEKRYGKIKSYSATFEHGEVFGPKRGWMFIKKLSGGGVLMNPGPHLFSLISQNFGKPSKVEGEIKRIHSSEVEDTAKLTLKYPSFIGKVSLSWSVPKNEVAQYTITCVFERGTVTATNTSITILQKGKKNTLSFADIPQEIEQAYTINPSAYGEAYYLESLDFVRTIQTENTRSPNTLQAALQTENIIFQAYKGTRT